MNPIAILRRWVLLSGNRRVIAIGLLVVVYGALLVAGFLWPFEIQRLLAEEPTIRDLMNTLLGGVILLVSIVVSVNSLVLSEELVPLDRQHERIVESWDYRIESADLVDSSVTSSVPTEYLREMLGTSQRELAFLARRIERGELDVSDEFTTQLEELESFTTNTRRVLDEYRLSSADMRLFAPKFDPNHHLNEARRISREEDLTEDAQESIETVIQALSYFTSGREYFKTMYYKREYARLSRDLLYSGIPAVILLSFLILVVSGDMFPGVTFGISHMYLFVGLAYTISLSPFFILTAYVLRAAVIAEDTVTASGFVTE